ncbi:MAG: hypothetical protein OW721_02990 [Buchnera aphidicola (Macrosiphum albifrons)]|uniref:Uncharacterized protein n=1 Tax=Buchnera aphidicola (Macrosiphum albifrons) TaxID=2994844 RepID=A0AAJ5TWS9_9GAMM|nr:MAG: hypothetical protein OW721_02990 [Buchnera aphidicola (Macrosiphum albifrons)]
MSSNFLFNIDIVNKRYSNKIDIYEDTIKKMLNNKKNIDKFQKTNFDDKNSEKLNDRENKTNLTSLENSYKNSLILLEIMQKKIKQTVLDKYDIEENSDIEENEKKDNNIIIKKSDDEKNQNILIKKNS